MCNFLEAYARMRGSSQIHFLSTNLVFQIELSLLYGKDSSEVPKPEHDDEGSGVGFSVLINNHRMCSTLKLN